MRKYIDTHCHLNGKFYTADVSADITAALNQGVEKIIIPATCEEDSLQAIKLAKTFPNVFACAGIHPCDAFEENVADFLEKIDPSEIIAVGETGIDLYHTETNPPLKKQLVSFQKHIKYALKHKKPLIVHGRNAEQEVYEELVKYPDLKIIMHCYTGNWEWARKFLELGAYISISGAVTYNKTETISEVARKVPLDKLIVETDAPFLTPVPHRGKPNKPEFVRFTADFVAKLRDEEDEVVIKALYDNSVKLFSI